MSYGYRFQLPPNLSSKQHDKLTKLALNTARGASVVATGRFRRGWNSYIKNNVLIVENRVYYAVFLELGTIHNRQHRFKVRDALNRIGFDTFKPVIHDQNIVHSIDERSSESSGIEDKTNPSFYTHPASNIAGANPAEIRDLLLPSDDPVDILISSVPHFNDQTRPEIPYKINTHQEAIEASKKVFGLSGVTTEDAISQYKKLIGQKIPITNLFNHAALLSLIAAIAIQKPEPEEPDSGETDLQGT